MRIHSVVLQSGEICNVEDGHVTRLRSVEMIGSGLGAQVTACAHLCERIMGFRRALARCECGNGEEKVLRERKKLMKGRETSISCLFM